MLERFDVLSNWITEATHRLVDEVKDNELRMWRDQPRIDERFSASLGPDVTARPRLEAMSLHLFAGLRVRDFQAARAWYEQLLGEPPTFSPHATEAVWTLAEDRSVYVVQDAAGAGHSAVTIFLDDLDAKVAAIAARGLEPDARETYPKGVRKIVYRDPDGNELGFGGAPLNDG
jgi:hypothetical protein